MIGLGTSRSWINGLREQDRLRRRRRFVSFVIPNSSTVSCFRVSYGREVSPRFDAKPPTPSQTRRHRCRRASLRLPRPKCVRTATHRRTIRVSLVKPSTSTLMTAAKTRPWNIPGCTTEVPRRRVQTLTS